MYLVSSQLFFLIPKFNGLRRNEEALESEWAPQNSGQADPTPRARNFAGIVSISSEDAY